VTSLIRIIEVEINNFKNVESGKVTFNSCTCSNKKGKSDNVLGIYGQNASGKTTFIEALYLLKILLSGEKINSFLLELLRNGENSFFKYTFYIQSKVESYKVSYSFELGKDKLNNKVEVRKEKIKCSIFNGEVKTNTKTIIDYNIDNDCYNVIKPIATYNMFTKNEKNKIGLLISKALSKENNISFVFNQSSMNNYRTAFGEESEYYKILDSLNYFGKHNLLVLCSECLNGNIDGLTLGVRYKLFSEDKENMLIELRKSETNKLNDNSYEVIQGVIENINTVLESIIPGFKLGIKKKNKALIQEYDIERELEFVSIRDNLEFPFKYEAEGTRKIVSILGLMIAVYNDPKVCLVIDELDSGMFEYLFGEILTVFGENSKGQFIFTANNLRGLEVLDKRSIIFTTTNPKNKYIKFKGVKTTNNLRSLYLRSIIYGGQEECLYKSTDKEKIDRKLKTSWNKKYGDIMKKIYD